MYSLQFSYTVTIAQLCPLRRAHKRKKEGAGKRRGPGKGGGGIKELNKRQRLKEGRKYHGKKFTRS